MSKYTTELRFICESKSGLTESVPYPEVDDVIAHARGVIFDFDYPLFDDTYKEVIETKILRHYYTREIGFETYGLWKLKLETKLNEIMPYYNKLYNSELLEFNPLYDVNYTRSGSESTSTSESASTSLATSTSESESGSDQSYNSMLPNTFSWTLDQDTPQNGLTGVAEMEYLTAARKTINGGDDQSYTRNQNESQSQGTSATNSRSGKQALDTKGYLESIVGYRSNNPSKLLSEYRDTFLNIDMMVINELDELFMQLW